MLMIVYGLLAVLLILCITFMLDRDGFWYRIFGSPDLGEVEFATLSPRGSPNEALACPAGECPNFPGTIQSPVISADLNHAREWLIAGLAERKDCVRVDDGASPDRLRYVFRSPLMRYPDTVNIKLVPLEDNRLTIAIHSAAQIGYSDLGANRARVSQLLKLFEATARP